MTGLKRPIYFMLIGGTASMISNSLLAYIFLGAALWRTQEIYRMILLLLPSMIAVGAITGLVAGFNTGKQNGYVLVIVAPLAWFIGYVVAPLIFQAIGLRGFPAYILIIVVGTLIGILLLRLVDLARRTA